MTIVTDMQGVHHERVMRRYFFPTLAMQKALGGQTRCERIYTLGSPRGSVEQMTMLWRPAPTEVTCMLCIASSP